MFNLRSVFIQAFLISAILLITTPAWSVVECTDYELSLQLQQSVSSLSSILCLDSTSELVVAAGDHVLTVLERSEDGLLHELSNLTIEGFVVDLALCNNLAVLAVGIDGLVFVDLANPAQPTIIATMATTSPVIATSSTDTPYLVATATEDGLVSLYFLSDESAPLLVDEIPTGHPLRSIASANDHIYAGGEESLQTISMINPPALEIVHTINDTSNLFDQFVADYRHLSVSENQLLAASTYWYEWSDEWSSYYVEGPALTVFDLSNPGQPDFSGWNINSSEKVALVPEFSAIVTENTLEIFNTSIFENEGTYPLGGTLQDITISGDYIYIAAAGEGIQVIDATYPHTPTAVSTYAMETNHAFAKSARYDLTLTDLSNGNWHTLGYKIYSLADPLNPVISLQGSVGGMNSTPMAHLYAVEDDYVCFSASSYYQGVPLDVRLFDFSHDPYKSVTLPISTDHVVLDGTIAWVHDYNFLRAISFSDFYSPVEIGSLDTDGHGLQKSGDNYFLLNYPTSQSIQILDLSDPTQPQMGPSVTLPGVPLYNRFVTHRGYLLFVLNNGDMAVVDPQLGQLVSTIALPNTYCSLSSSDKVVLVHRVDEMWVMSLDDPYEPVYLTETITTPFSISNIQMQDDLAYLGNNNNGPVVYDLSTPDHPIQLGSSSGPGGAVFLGENFLRTEGGVYPLHCFALGGIEDDNEWPRPSPTIMRAAAPNPFNPTTELKFVLGQTQKVDLNIYDLKGQLVRNLVAEELPAGNHVSVWDGRDQNGAPMPSGIYFARLKAGNVIESRKLALIK